MEDASYQSSEILLSPDDLVLLYTDGLIEVQSPNSDLYTQQLLQSAVQRLLNDPAPKLFDALTRRGPANSPAEPLSPTTYAWSGWKCPLSTRDGLPRAGIAFRLSHPRSGEKSF